MTARLLLATKLPTEKRNRYLKQFPTLTGERLDEFASWDPSPKGQFVPWIIKWGLEEKIDSGVKGLLERYLQKSKDPKWMKDDRNVGAWTPERLKKILGGKLRHQLQQMPENELRTKLFTEGLPGAKLVLNDGTWKVWRVSSIQYAQLLGVGTEWCTARKDHAQHYLSCGPLYPIYKSDKPYAQGHVGGEGRGIQTSGKFILLGADDQPLPFDHETLEMLEALRPLPDYQYFERYLWATLQTLPEDPKLLKLVQDYIVETDDHKLLALYLGSHFWDEGWELLLDMGFTRGIQLAIGRAHQDENHELLDKILAMDCATELVPHIQTIVPKMLPLFIQTGQLTDYMERFPEASKIDLSKLSLSPADLKELTKWVVKQKSMGALHIFTVDPASIQIVWVPYWKAQFAPRSKFFSGQKHEAMLKACEEYREAYESRPAQPALTVSIGENEAAPMANELQVGMKMGPRRGHSAQDFNFVIVGIEREQFRARVEGRSDDQTVQNSPWDERLHEEWTLIEIGVEV